MKKAFIPTLIIVVFLSVWLTYTLSQNDRVVENTPKLEATATSDGQENPANQATETNQKGVKDKLTEQIEENQAIAVSSLQKVIKKAIRRVKPSVVLIEVTRKSDVESPFEDFFDDPFFKRFFGEPPFQEKRVKRSLGSGFIIEFEQNKYILTNRHVVHGSNQIRITTPQGRIFEAELVGSDSRLDVAILRPSSPESNNLPPVVLGDSVGVEIGDWVIAIGNPLGLKHTVTWGIISALDRDVPKPDGEGYFRNMIQTDAAVNPGNSGGPLVNMDGEVIAINTAIARLSEGINFAVPIDSIKTVLPQLINKGEVIRAWLGVGIQPLTPALAEQFGVKPEEGVLVAQVFKGWPAEKAGLKKGDIILKVGEEKVESIDELQRAIMFKDVGQTVILTILREGQELVLEATLAKRPLESEVSSQTQPQMEEESVQKFGIKVEKNSKELDDELDLSTTQSVVIMEVTPGSKADWAGLKIGDVILEVNGQIIRSVKDWNQIVSGISEEETSVLYIMRREKTFYVTLE